jgi:hypothetical protein
MIEQGLFQLVTLNPTIQAAVGADVNGTTKAWWVLAPQGSVLPFLVFSRVSTADTYAMSGPTQKREAVFQIVCYSTSYYGSRTIAKAVRTYLGSYKGTLPDGTVVDGVIVDKDWDDRYEEGSKSFVYGAYLQFRVFYFD